MREYAAESWNSLVWSFQRTIWQYTQKVQNARVLFLGTILGKQSEMRRRTFQYESIVSVRIISGNWQLPPCSATVPRLRKWQRAHGRSFEQRLDGGDRSASFLIPKYLEMTKVLKKSRSANPGRPAAGRAFAECLESREGRGRWSSGYDQDKAPETRSRELGSPGHHSALPVLSQGGGRHLLTWEDASSRLGTQERDIVHVHGPLHGGRKTIVTGAWC